MLHLMQPDKALSKTNARLVPEASSTWSRYVPGATR